MSGKYSLQVQSERDQHASLDCRRSSCCDSPRFEDREDGQADPKDLPVSLEHDQIPDAHGGFKRNLMQEQGRKIGRGDPNVDRLAIGVNLGKEVGLQIVEDLQRASVQVNKVIVSDLYRRTATHSIVGFDLFVNPAIERTETRSVQQVSEADERHGNVHVHQEHARQEVYSANLSRAKDHGARSAIQRPD